MSTILRIGSLMKVGFGSAGVEIIRKSLEKGQSRNMLLLSSQGTSVSCIFLFCDIRNFTDATECLQEEVFVFTNRIAAVVHSHCAAYGGKYFFFMKTHVYNIYSFFSMKNIRINFFASETHTIEMGWVVFFEILFRILRRFC